MCLSPLQGHWCLTLTHQLLSELEILQNGSDSISFVKVVAMWWFYYSDCTVQASSYTLITFGINPASQT